MKSSIELKELRSDYISKLEVIKETCKAEERELNSDENTEMDSILSKIDDVDVKIERAEKIEASLRSAAKVSGIKVENKVDKDLKKFRFQDAMKQAYNGKLEGVVKEAHEEAINECRYTGGNVKGIGIPSSVLTRAQDYVDTTNQNSVETMSFTDQLEANLVMASAGANFYSGINNMKFPVVSGITSAFQPETGGTEADGTGATTNVTLSPKKLISIVNISQESLVQNTSIEAALQRNMAANIAATMESAFLSAADVTNAPTSLLADATSSATSALSAANVLKLETDTLDANVALEGARMAYIMNTAAYSAVKGLAQVSNVSAIWDNADKRLNGYFGFITSNLNNDGTAGKEATLFGDFRKVHIAQFGGLDILFDPYTYSGVGVPRMVITSLVDAAAVQAATFHKIIEA
jgi:HK97 family phage major capsid protein